ncbi:hypothetical protein PM8797T_11219 [Gimesia maris DSM 8797]|nr:hypothetical protein PM8797T_11219 [Gimesia maris DSM 8797]
MEFANQKNHSLIASKLNDKMK